MILVAKKLQSVSLASVASCQRPSNRMSAVSVRCLSILLVYLAVVRPACGEIQVISGKTMGTTYSVRLDPTMSISTETLAAKINDRLETINNAMSTYIADSEVVRFNQSNSTEWFPVSEDTARVIAMAQKVAHQSNGAFDVTVSPLVALWKFGADAETAKGLPTDEQINDVQRNVGYAKLEVSQSPPQIRKTNPLLKVDLSAIAKGYAVDEVARLLVDDGQERFLVEIGGELTSRGTKSNGSPWMVGIESPTPEARRIATTIPLTNQSLATSGDYRSFFEYEGVKYSHTINPKTGKPAQHTLSSVSVLYPDCAIADAFATAILVMGPEIGLEWAQANQIDAMLLSRNHGQFAESIAGAFPTLKKKPAGGYFQLLTISVAVFGIAIIAMAVGVIFGKRRIQGSCGGLAGLTDDQGRTLCEGCTNPSSTCNGAPLNEKAT